MGIKEPRCSNNPIGGVLKMIKQETYNIQHEFMNQGFTPSDIKKIVEIIANTKTEEFQDFLDFEYFGEYRVKKENKIGIIDNRKESL